MSLTGKINLRPVPPPPIPPLRAVPPPLPPILKSVPPPPAPPILSNPPPRPDIVDPVEEDPTRNDYRGALVPQSTVTRVFGETRAMVVKLFERMRTIQQMRSAVAIGRVEPRAFDAARVNKLVVSTYKLVGFAVLTLIALALISYLGANVFYWFSTSWVEPTVIAPTDERVLALSTQLLQQSSARDKVAAELADAERVTHMQEEFLDGARKALTDELADRKGELSRLAALDRSFATTRAEVAHSGRAYSDMSKRQLAAEYGAHFIDKQTAVAGALQLSQIAQGNLSLAQKEVELYKRRAELSRETEALGAIVGTKPAGRHSIEVLKILQDVKRAEVELAKARDNRVVLQRSLERYDKMVKTLNDSAFLRAVDGKDNVAFVPYENLDRIKPGTPLYGCWIGPLFCKKVGTVVALLPGEMSYKHPLHNTQLRGQSVQLSLVNPRDAERKVLFAGGRPLLF